MGGSKGDLLAPPPSGMPGATSPSRMSRVFARRRCRVGGAFGPFYGPFRGRGRVVQAYDSRGKDVMFPFSPPSRGLEGNFCLSSRPRAVARSPSPDLRRHARPRTHCRHHTTPLEVTETEEGVVETALERKLTVETEEGVVETALEMKLSVKTEEGVVETALERKLPVEK